MIFSQEAYAREIKTLNKNYAKKGEQEYKEVLRLLNQPFGCEQDALKAWERLRKKCKTLILTLLDSRQKPCYESPGRPPKNQPPDRMEWYLQAEVACSVEAYEQIARTKGRFIVATNELDQNKLPDK